MTAISGCLIIPGKRHPRTISFHAREISGWCQDLSILDIFPYWRAFSKVIGWTDPSTGKCSVTVRGEQSHKLLVPALIDLDKRRCVQVRKYAEAYWPYCR